MGVNTFEPIMTICLGNEVPMHAIDLRKSRSPTPVAEFQFENPNSSAAQKSSSLPTIGSSLRAEELFRFATDAHSPHSCESESISATSEAHGKGKPSPISSQSDQDLSFLSQGLMHVSCNNLMGSDVSSTLKGSAVLEKPLFRHWCRCKRRYLEFQALSRCIFYWRKESDRDKGRAKCFGDVVGAKLLNNDQLKKYTVLQVAYAKGKQLANFRFASHQEAARWADELSSLSRCESTVVVNSSQRTRSPSSSCSKQLPTPNRAFGVSQASCTTSSGADQGSDPVLKIRSIFAKELAKQRSNRTFSKKGSPSGSPHSSMLSIISRDSDKFLSFSGLSVVH